MKSFLLSTARSSDSHLDETLTYLSLLLEVEMGQLKQRIFFLEMRYFKIHELTAS